MKKIGKYLLVLIALFAFVAPYAKAEEIINADINSAVVQNKKVTITVKNVDINNKVLSTESKKYNQGEGYKITAKEISGYKLMSESSTVVGTANANTEITFVYHPVADLFIRIDSKIQYENGSTGYPESEYVYVGNTSVTGKKVYDVTANTSTDLNFILKLSERVENEVTTQVTDKEVIKFLNDTYKVDLQEDDDIIWYVLKETSTKKETRTYKDINGKDVKVEVAQCLYHIDGIVMKKGKVTTNYVDEDGKELTTSTVDSYYYGESYTTKAKEFTDYELIETKGKESGEVNTRETSVTYIYQFTGGQGDDEPEEDPEEEPIEEPEEKEEPVVVQTGSKFDYSIMSSALITISLIGLAIVSKKRNN